SLQRLNLSTKEKAAIAQVAKAWKDYGETWKAEVENSEEQTDFIPVDLDTSLQMLQISVQNLDAAVSAAVKARLSDANLLGVEAERVSWTIGCIALAMGGFISILLLYTINRSVRQLSQGTHAIAQGDFGHRIPAKGRDEFAQVARDFNSMSQRLGE